MTKLKQQIIELNKSRNNGELKCYICGCALNESETKSHVLEHKDNNRKNNEISNLDIACRGCNKKKDPSNIFKLLRNKAFNIDSIYTHTRIQREENELSIGTVGMAKHITGQKAVKDWFSKKKLMLLVDFYSRAAAVGKVTRNTIKEWVPVWICEEGHLRVRDIKDSKGEVHKWIMLKRLAVDFDNDNKELKQ